MYAAWEYEKEEKVLDEASKRGLQLIKGGCFCNKFYKDSSVRYIYQLDYNPNIGDRLRYLEVFEEQGWEYINSIFNGWHYFRKPYKEGMEESESKIYTDKHSLYEMQNRWLRLIIGVDIFYIIFAAFYLVCGISIHQTMLITEGIVFGLLGLTFSLGTMSILRKRKGKKGWFTIPIQIVMPIALLVFIIILILTINGLGYDTVHTESFTFKGEMEAEIPIDSGTFTIEKGEYQTIYSYVNSDHEDGNIKGHVDLEITK